MLIRRSSDDSAFISFDSLPHWHRIIRKSTLNCCSTNRLRKRTESKWDTRMSTGTTCKLLRLVVIGTFSSAAETFLTRFSPVSVPRAVYKWWFFCFSDARRRGFSSVSSPIVATVEVLKVRGTKSKRKSYGDCSWKIKKIPKAIKVREGLLLACRRKWKRDQGNYIKILSVCEFSTFLLCVNWIGGGSYRWHSSSRYWST